MKNLEHSAYALLFMAITGLLIGLIYKPSGVKLKDKDGFEYDEMVDVGGWHVNLRGVLPDTIKPYQITVTGIPHRIWD